MDRLQSLSGTEPPCVTVLTSVSGKLATKRFTSTGVVSYGQESRWHWRKTPLPDFASLSALLVFLEDRRVQMIVLGSIAPECRDARVIPRWKKPNRGKPPSLIDTGSRIVHFDVDDLPMPEDLGWQDPEAVAQYTWAAICAKVPALRDVSVHWQASSSAGMPGKEHQIRMHLWAMLDQPIDEGRRAALLIMAGTDKALASINQPNYTAVPIFEGVPDPLAGVARSGDILGSQDFARTGQIPFPEARDKRRQNRRPTVRATDGVAPEGLTHRTTPAGAKALQTACTRIRSAVSGSRNTTIYNQAYTIGGLVSGGQIAWAEAREALLSAGEASGHPRFRNAVANGLRDGLAAPIWDMVQDGDPDPILPFYPAPNEDRQAAINRHSEVIAAWADKSIRRMRAFKEFRRRCAAAGIPADADCGPEEGLPGEADLRLQIRREVQCEFSLDHLPASVVTEAALVPRVMLTGAQGVGKTAALVGRKGSPGALHRAGGLVSLMLLPDGAKAAEACDDYVDNAPANAPPAMLLRGRGASDPEKAEGARMCELSDVAGKLAGRGISVRKALCEPCPHRKQCGYMRQEKQIRGLTASLDGVVLFGTHDYAFVPLPCGAVPDLAIFDERPRDFCVETAELSFEALGDTLAFDAPLAAQNAIRTASDQTDADAALRCDIRPLMIALRNAGQDHPECMLAALRDAGIGRDQILQAIRGLDFFQDRATAQAMRDAVTAWQRSGSEDGRKFSLEDRLAEKIESRAEKTTHALKIILSALLIEIDKPRPDATGLFVGDVARRPGSPDRAKGIIASRLKTLALGRVPFLHLDGTGDHDLAQRLLGEMVHEDHRVERTPAGRPDRIVQVVGPEFHNAGLIGARKSKGNTSLPYFGGWNDTYKAQVSDIEKLIFTQPGAFVAANKSVIAALAPEDLGARSGYFGALRGRNTWEECDTAIIIGREQPASADVERIARAYAASDDAPFESLNGKEYPKLARRIRMRHGSAHALQVAQHPDPRADRVLRQIREAEIAQAIDRIRPIYKNKPIKVFLLSPVVVDVTVDQVISWTDFKKGGTRIEKALEQVGVIPLSSREAARLLPGVWASEFAARADLETECLSRSSVNRDLYLRSNAVSEWVVASYRLEIQPGSRRHEHRALIAAPADQARAVLETLTGSLSSFEVVEVLARDSQSQAEICEPATHPMIVKTSGQDSDGAGPGAPRVTAQCPERIEIGARIAREEVAVLPIRRPPLPGTRKPRDQVMRSGDPERPPHLRAACAARRQGHVTPALPEPTDIGHPSGGSAQKGPDTPQNGPRLSGVRWR